MAADLRQEIAAADAVLFCTPEYAGTLPGSFKNLLDWTVGGGEIYGKPAVWINPAAVRRDGFAGVGVRLCRRRHHQVRAPQSVSATLGGTGPANVATPHCWRPARFVHIVDSRP